MPFDNIDGLYALLSLIPLIIIYLKKPRPKEKKIPSLMFIMKASGFTTAHTIFRKLIHNLLFLFQLLALISLSLAVAVPYMDLPAKYVAKHTVIVLDTSASMQVKHGLKTRFDEAKSIAKDNLGGLNSIILASQNPYIAANSVHSARARKVIDQIKPTDSVTNLGSAILAAEMMINESSGRVVVISDFIPTLGPDPNEAKRILSSKNIDVEFIDISESAENIGIIDIEYGNDKSKAYIKNYNDKKESVSISLIKDGNTVDKISLDILPHSIETAIFDTLPGRSMIELDTKDDFLVDNRAYISSPEKEKISVLLITNQRNSNIEIALRSSPRIALTIEEPPRISSYDYDVIIFSNINTKILLPSTPDDVERKVKQGASAIIITQPDMKNINWFSLMPVSISDYLNESTINVDIFNKFSKSLQSIGEGKEAGKYSTSHYFNATASNNSIVIATADDETPLIAIKKIDKGKSVYYGIEDQNEFVLSQDYPIFWNNLVYFLVERGDISDYNRRFTDFYTINITVQGIYNIKGKDVSVNLLDKIESDVGASGINRSSVMKRDMEEFEIEESKHKMPYSFEKFLIMLVFALFIAEIFIIKSRGDI